MKHCRNLKNHQNWPEIPNPNVFLVTFWYKNAHSAWIGDVARAKSTACRAWCYSEDFEISQFHAFYHHMSVYFGNLVKKKKADAEVRSRLELQFATNSNWYYFWYRQFMKSAVSLLTSQ